MKTQHEKVKANSDPPATAAAALKTFHIKTGTLSKS
jgi:hypothetical protein